MTYINLVECHSVCISCTSPGISFVGKQVRDAGDFTESPNARSCAMWRPSADELSAIRSYHLHLRQMKVPSPESRDVLSRILWRNDPSKPYDNHCGGRSCFLRLDAAHCRPRTKALSEITPHPMAFITRWTYLRRASTMALPPLPESRRLQGPCAVYLCRL